MWPFTQSRSSKFERQVMSALSTLQASVALNTTLTAQVVSALANATVGAPDSALTAIQASVDTNNTALQAALAPVAPIVEPPAPAPAA